MTYSKNFSNFCVSHKSRRNKSGNLKFIKKLRSFDWSPLQSALKADKILESFKGVIGEIYIDANPLVEVEQRKHLY